MYTFCLTTQFKGNVNTGIAGLQRTVDSQLEMHRNHGGNRGQMLDLLTSFGVIGFGDVIQVLIAEGIFKENLVFQQDNIQAPDELRAKLTLRCSLGFVPRQLVGGQAVGDAAFRVELGPLFNENQVFEVRVGAVDQRLITLPYLVSGVEVEGADLDDSGVSSPQLKRARMEERAVVGFDMERLEGLISGLEKRGLVVVSKTELVTQADLLLMEERVLERVEAVVKKWGEKGEERRRELLREVKGVMEGQAEVVIKMEGRLAQGSEAMEGRIINGVSKMVARIKEGLVGDCSWCEAVECEGWISCQVRKGGRIKECIICGNRQHPWGKCAPAGFRLGVDFYCTFLSF